MKNLVGIENTDSVFSLIIDSPEYYLLEEQIDVYVRIDDVKLSRGIDSVSFYMYYDRDKLTLINDLDENDNCVLMCMEKLPDKWVNYSNVENNYDEVKDQIKDGVQVEPINDGIIYACAFTSNIATASINSSDELVFKFSFIVKDGISEEIGIWIPHIDVECAKNGFSGIEVYKGNGGYTIIPLHIHEDTVYDCMIACEICGRKNAFNGLFYDKYDNQYYCANEGEIVTGWQKINGEWHFFNPVTMTALKGNVVVNGISYDFDETGKVSGSLVDVDNDGNVDTIDYILVKRISLGTYTVK